MTVPIVVAAGIAAAAYALRLLTRGGAIVAAAIGTAAMIGGARWVALLLLFFVTANALARWKGEERERLVGPFLEKGNRRDAMQVIANGGVFGLAAFLATRGDPLVWEAIGIGAIAAATSDTWSTEIGTVLGKTPRSILSGRLVTPGTSGGITIAGSVAAIVAAVLVAGVAGLVQWTTPWPAILAGGLAGSVVDSLLGAAVQERRWCPSCDQPTERRVHTCGTPTVDRGGIPGCTNDIVNLMSTVAGAVVTWVLT